MHVGICDFPSAYPFPPAGYGGIERWLWAVAVGARAAGADVTLLGPQWRRDLPADWARREVRLESLHPADTAVRRLRADRFDLLVVGHEYPSLPAWRAVADQLGCDVATFQHDPRFQHAPTAFDGVQTRLYCYSPEMTGRYATQRPIRELAVHLGLNETEPPATRGDDLVWMGRIDADKAPHLAVMAARLLGRRIRIIGPIFDPAYAANHAGLFRDSHVEMVGELGGSAKVAALRAARVFVYSAARDYIEAGAAVFGESLRAGTPVAALAWRPGTCAEAALCTDTGTLASIEAADDDDQAAKSLAEAIARAATMPASTVQEIGLNRFDPQRHFTVLAARPS